MKHHPFLFFISFLFLTSLACQASTATRPAVNVEVSTSEIVDSAVATVVAQTGSGDPVVNASAGGMSLDLQNTLTAVYQRVSPAVVHIFVFNDFNFGLGSGSGFVYSDDGYIVTNNHVVADAETIEVGFADGSRVAAELIGTDIDSDLAVIKVETLPNDIQPVPLGESRGLVAGQFVIAIGNPFGEEGSMSLGIVSGLGRTLESQRIAEGGGRYSLPQVIQTDAAINPGNSGGPLLNLNGEVVGVNSAILTSTGTNSGVGFSIPVNAVKRIVPALVEAGEYVYPFMGISMRGIDSLELQERLGLPQVQGAYVVGVQAGTPADEANLVASGTNNLGQLTSGGDFIVAINDVPIKNPDELISYLVFETSVDETIMLTVFRDGEEVTVPLTLGARP